MNVVGRRIVHAIDVPAHRPLRYISIRCFVAMCATGVGLLSERTAPPRSADVKTKCFTPWARAASIMPWAWASSEPAGPWTVTRKTPSMDVFADLKIASGLFGSPAMRVTRESRAARDLALLEVMLRVRARMVAVGERRGLARSCFTVAPPWVPVAPTTRKV